MECRGGVVYVVVVFVFACGVMGRENESRQGGSFKNG
jgi:hypothetical protein